MKTKRLLEILSLSTNLYMLSKDEELMARLKEAVKKGTAKVNDMAGQFMHEESEEEEEKAIESFLEKAKQLRDEFEKKVEETVARAYEKMNIAHTGEIKKLQDQLAAVKKELALAEARLVNLESGK